MVEVREEGGQDEGRIGGVGGGGRGGREGGSFGEEVLGGDPAGGVPELDDAEDGLWREGGREGGREGRNEWVS